MNDCKYYFQRLKINKSFQNIIDNIRAFSESTKCQIYVLDKPLLEPSAFNNECGFILLTPKRKILIVGTNDSLESEEFEEYYSDVLDDISYISKKFGFEPIIGRRREWERLIKQIKVDELLDFKNFYENDCLVDDRFYRRIDVLISLFIGSINDAQKIRIDEPENLIDKIKYKIQLFDTDQTRFIYDALPADQRIVKIQGLAGTGKTELLLHKLKELYINEPNCKIAITCHNRVLANSLKERLPAFFNAMRVEQQIDWNNRLWCFNAWGNFGVSNSGLLSLISESYNVPFYSYRDTHSFDLACKYTIQNISFNKQESRKILDYIFVDESQDFEQSFVELCNLITSKRVYLAGDVFQSIFEDKNISKLTSDYLLSRCYRTDPKTLMFAQALGMGLFETRKLSWMDNDKWEMCGYSVKQDDNNEFLTLTREPIKRFEDLSADYESLVIEETDDFSSTIIQQIKNLQLEYKNLKPSDICIIFLDNEDYVFTSDSIIGKRIEEVIGWGYVLAHETKHIDPEKISITNRNNVKGLEFPFVFCITKQITRNYSYRNALYTMLSRSFLRSYLIIKKGNNGLTKDIKNGQIHIMKYKNMVVRIPSEQEIAEIKREFEVNKDTKSLHERTKEIMNKINIPMELFEDILNAVEGFVKKKNAVSYEKLENFIKATYEVMQ